MRGKSLFPFENSIHVTLVRICFLFCFFLFFLFLFFFHAVFACNFMEIFVLCKFGLRTDILGGLVDFMNIKQQNANDFSFIHFGGAPIQRSQFAHNRLNRRLGCATLLRILLHL